MFDLQRLCACLFLLMLSWDETALMGSVVGHQRVAERGEAITRMGT